MKTKIYANMMHNYVCDNFICVQCTLRMALKLKTAVVCLHGRQVKVTVVGLMAIVSIRYKKVVLYYLKTCLTRNIRLWHGKRNERNE